MIPRFAVITTHNRPAELKNLVSQLAGQQVNVIIIDNASDPPVNENEMAMAIGDGFVSIVREPLQPPNLYRFWNIGFTVARNLAGRGGHTLWNVAVFNDDTSLPHGWYGALDQALRASSVAAVCGALHHAVHVPIVKTSPDGDIMHRMTPHAWMMKGELGLLADENFEWWWGDTDFDWTLRMHGGVMVLPGFIADNTDANGYTNRRPELGARTGVDRQVFQDKWGRVPW